MDAIAYESVLVGLFSIYSGVMKPPSGPTAMEWQGDEHNAIHLGYSRDGFHFHRPSPTEGAGPTPVNLSEAAAATVARSSIGAAAWRTPFIDENEGPKVDPRIGWTYGNVQSVGGGLLVVGDQLRFFFSARSGTSVLNCTTGVAHLRRDGFASLRPSEAATEAFLLTKPMRYTKTAPPWGPTMTCPAISRQNTHIPVI